MIIHGIYQLIPSTCTIFFSKFEVKIKGSSILKRKKGRSNISFTSFPGVKKNPPFNFSNQNLSIEQKKFLIKYKSNQVIYHKGKNPEYELPIFNIYFGTYLTKKYVVFV